MQLLHTSLMRHRALALLVVMTALCMKILVPTGFMIGQDSRILTVRICADASGSHTARQLVIPIRDAGGESGSKQDGNSKKGECPFASLSMASIAATDPALLALALVFILALGFAPTPIPLPRRVHHLRPPLRGPPALV